MRPNIGTVDALIRITIGFVLLAWTASKSQQRMCHRFPFFTGLMGALKVAEGITRFCPVYYVCKKNQKQRHQPFSH
ncbi:YgaP family membrane protein [Alkalihalobacillus pseudalcaliphilus]|uniref:YgaP family membrane protein n=1 Tax=Alkalihalobacillus pseudalcaliphilus TaxID=79884 RepID=UPI00064DC7B4|nr:DUF2892 domain-containing protein [Alkalihalobacillus pseudalcaliphilus]KMK75308.1 hypothetical protein AB990_18010 [Alkalihalobacillus pseudalcaliphilus]